MQEGDPERHRRLEQAAEVGIVLEEEEPRFRSAVVREVAHRRAQDREPGRQRSLLGQVVQRREELASAQVAGGAEDDHDGRVRDPVVMQSFG